MGFLACLPRSMSSGLFSMLVGCYVVTMFARGRRFSVLTNVLMFLCLIIFLGVCVMSAVTMQMENVRKSWVCVAALHPLVSLADGPELRHSNCAGLTHHLRCGGGSTFVSVPAAAEVPGSGSNVCGIQAKQSQVAAAEVPGSGSNVCGIQAKQSQVAAAEVPGSGSNVCGTQAKQSQVAAAEVPGSGSNVCGTQAKQSQVAAAEVPGSALGPAVSPQKHTRQKHCAGQHFVFFGPKSGAQLTRLRGQHP